MEVFTSSKRDGCTISTVPDKAARKGDQAAALLWSCTWHFVWLSSCRNTKKDLGAPRCTSGPRVGLGLDARIARICTTETVCVTALNHVRDCTEHPPPIKSCSSRVDSPDYLIRARWSSNQIAAHNVAPPTVAPRHSSALVTLLPKQNNRTS